MVTSYSLDVTMTAQLTTSPMSGRNKLTGGVMVIRWRRNNVELEEQISDGHFELAVGTDVEHVWVEPIPRPTGVPSHLRPSVVVVARAAAEGHDVCG